MRLAAWVAAMAVTVVCAVADARAQDYPNRPVTIVAPAAPGGLYSLFARLVGTKLEQRFGKPFVVENRPGASSVVGTLSVVRAAPDGHTLMVATSSTMATNLTLFKALPYDPRTDLTPVALIARVPEVLVVNAALPVQSVADIAKLAKETPGGLHFGSAGPGTAQHLGGEMLKAALGRATDPCSLQRHAAGDQRRRRRPYRHDLQPDPDRAADDPGRQGQADRPVHGATHRGAAGRGAAERSRGEGFRRGVLVHAGGAGQDAAGYRHAARHGAARHRQRCGNARGIRPARPRSGRLRARPMPSSASSNPRSSAGATWCGRPASPGRSRK